MKILIKSVLLAAAASLFLTQNVCSEGLHTWTDKNGVVHITSSPTEAERAKAKKARKRVAPSTSKASKTDVKTDVKTEDHEFIKAVRSEQKYEKDQIDKARRDAINVLDSVR